MAAYTQTNCSVLGGVGDSTLYDTQRTLSAPSGPVGPTSIYADASWSDTRRTLSAPSDSVGGVVVEADASWSDTRRTLTSDNGNLAPSYYYPAGVVIPTGNFRAVTVTLEDSKGEPLEEAELVQSAGLFPTASRVQEQPNGEMQARLWLLFVPYNEFNVLAEGGTDYGLVWSQEKGHQTPAVDAKQREATLQFTEVDPEGGGIRVSEGAGIGN